MVFRPMLAASENPLEYPKYFDEIVFPKWASPKYDGIRAIVKDGYLMSRSFKPIPSIQCQQEFWMVDHVDGELLEGNVFDEKVYNRTQSFVMSEEKIGAMSYIIFDYTHPDWLEKPFYQRYDKLREVTDCWKALQVAPQEPVETIEELLACEERWLEAGAEGLILTDPLSPYKQNRSTWRQNWRIKLKREVRDEGIVVGLVEREINNNEQTRNALGYAERSHHQANKEGCGMVGKFKVDFNGDIISVAPGNFTHGELKDMWEHPELCIGKFITFQHFPHGKKDLPRQPRAKGFRDEMDM